MKKITAQIIADSTNEHGNRITTFVLTYPRFIHAELLTHRLFSRNAASSRAIPAAKMIQEVKEDPFIPVAWQKPHSGMQGTEYYDHNIKEEPGGVDYTNLPKRWLRARDTAVTMAECMLQGAMPITKQLVNRILEPYQWYISIVTATEFDNFFELRCPQYEVNLGSWGTMNFKSIESAASYCEDLAIRQQDMSFDEKALELRELSDLEKLKLNKGAGEIHISLLAEAMWDARNESEPKQLKAGEWHVPFGDKIDEDRLKQFWVGDQKSSKMLSKELEGLKVKIATARCARVSYLNFEGKDDYEADIKLYDRLLAMKHMSPFEHCARAMSKYEYYSHVQGVVPTGGDDHGIVNYEYYPYVKPGQMTMGMKGENNNNGSRFGWSGNFRGFVQLRKEVESGQ